MTSWERKLKRMDGPGWVTGSLMPYEVILARVQTELTTHTTEEKSGKPWRWNIWNQCWAFEATGAMYLNKDEREFVEGWLEKEGWKEYQGNDHEDLVKVEN